MNPNAAEELREFARKIPKVELHLHLEGAIPLETLLAFIRRAGTEPDVRTVDDLRRRLAYPDFQGFLDTWVWKNKFITEVDDFAGITYDVLADLHAQNVPYVEMHYSPGDYRDRGFTVAGVTEAVLAGSARARRDFGLRCGLILDLLWGATVEAAWGWLEEATPFLGRGVVGVGLGGSEQKSPARAYAELYAEAGKRGFRLTAHAGEALGPESVRAVIDELDVERIGHGVRASEDPALLELLKERRIPLEVCVTSNVKTGVYPSAAAHPIRSLFESGVIVTVNADDPTMFHNTLSDEYLVLLRDLAFTPEDLKTLSLNGVEASFLPEAEKSVLRAKFEEEWEGLLKKYA
ncbi:MAG TPA: adenosine deaminase [bacterium]|nr:adenosine deaminase [bacterium]